MKNRLSIVLFKAVNTAFLMLTTFLIVSCSSMPEIISTQPDSWDADVVQKKKIKQWNLKARLGIQTESEGGAFDLFWKQDIDSYTIRLIAPLGMGALTIEGDSEAVKVRDAQGLTQHAANPDLLIKQSLGIDLPVSSLRQWLLGLPDRTLAVESMTWNGQGQLHRLGQAGWKIEMLRHQVVGESVVPHFFVLQRDDRPELDIRLIIRQWSFNG